MGEITGNMEQKQRGSLKPDRKMVLYSAHDVTIVNVWRALGFTDLIKPDYGASLFFELHTTRSGTNYEVKVSTCRFTHCAAQSSDTYIQIYIQQSH